MAGQSCSDMHHDCASGSPSSSPGLWTCPDPVPFSFPLWFLSTLCYPVSTISTPVVLRLLVCFLLLFPPCQSLNVSRYVLLVYYPAYKQLFPVFIVWPCQCHYCLEVLGSVFRFPDYDSCTCLWECYSIIAWHSKDLVGNYSTLLGDIRFKYLLVLHSSLILSSQHLCTVNADEWSNKNDIVPTLYKEYSVLFWTQKCCIHRAIDA